MLRLIDMVKRERALEPKMELFITAYLNNGFNAGKAVIEAGYKCNPNSARVRGSHLLADPRIQERVEMYLNKFAMTGNEVLARLTLQARSSIEDFLSIDKVTGKVTFDFRQAMAMHALGAIKKIGIKPTEFGDALEVEMYDAQSALIQLGKYHKLFTDKVHISDWRSDAIEAIRAGKIEFEQLRQTLGDNDLAEQLFREAGILVAPSKN